MTTHPTARHRAAARPTRAGFTLVEFMVALTGGLFVSIAVFLLAKQASRFYQREARMADATLGSVVGFERLRNDVARAGFMASPNVRRDPRLCGEPASDGNWPAYLGRLSSVFIEDTPLSDLPSVFAANGLAPQRITLAGSYASVDQFEARHIDVVSGGYEVLLNPNSGSMARLGYDPLGDGAELATVFQPGRAVRIVDRDSGQHQYGQIVSVTGGAQPRILLKDDAPTLQFRETSPYNCGYKSLQVGALLNVVNLVRYEIRNLSGISRYAPVYAAAGPDDASRTELVREELDVDGEVIDGTQELVTEHAVDLRFKVTVAASASSALQEVVDTATANWAGDPTTLVGNTGPQLIRSVRAWLSVRSREADREVTIAPPAASPLYRIGLGSSGGAPFARIRTLQAHIALRNQLGVTWQ